MEGAFLTNICLREAQVGQRLLSEVQREDSAVQAGECVVGELQN